MSPDDLDICGFENDKGEVCYNLPEHDWRYPHIFRPKGWKRPEARAQESDGFLTEDEHEAMRMSGDLFNHISQKVIGNNPEARPGDMKELVSHIHDLQRMIMSQAAGRAYPTRYRLLGEVIPKKEEVDGGDVQQGS